MKTNLFKLVFVMLLGITALVSSCSKDDKKDEVPAAPPEIKLSAPANGATLDMAAAEYATGITFTWVKDAKVTDYLLKISAEQTFATTVLNVSGNQDSYLWTSTEIEAKLVELSVDYEQSKTLYWTVVSAKLDQEAETETRSFTITRKQHPPKYGEWLFDDPANLSKATVGNDLEAKWGAGTVTEEDMFKSVAGVSDSDKALRIGYYGWFIARHGIAPLGTDTHINTYTILWDVNIRRTGSTLTYGLMATDLNHNTPTYHFDVNPICMYFNSVREFSGNVMYSIDEEDDLPDYTMPVDEWHRLVVRLDLVSQVYDAYIDGVLIATIIERRKERLIPNECRWAWPPEGVVLFPPIGETPPEKEKELDISRVTIWDYCLTPEEIQALGRAGDPTDIGNN